MRDELARPDAVCAVAAVGHQVIGAAWGFSATAQELEEHLNHGLAPEARVHGVEEALLREFPGVARFGYQDEIFVRPEWQGRGIGKQLFWERHRRFRGAGISVGVLRTSSNPPSSSFRWYHDRWGYTQIRIYPDERRVVLAKRFAELLEPGL